MLSAHIQDTEGSGFVGVLVGHLLAAACFVAVLHWYLFMFSLHPVETLLSKIFKNSVDTNIFEQVAQMERSVLLSIFHCG